MGTLLDHRRALLRAVPELGKTYTLTALATGSITIGSLANSNFPTNLYRNAIAWRGEASTAADNLRYLGTLTNTTGLITQTGANYSDTTVTNEEVEIWYDPELRPDTDINPLMEEALSQLRVLCRTPLAHGPIDYDMQASGITNWTANSGTPFAKQTTAAEVLRGRSGVLTDAGSGGDYTQSALYPMQGSTGTMFFIAKADTGTGKFMTLDGSSNEQASVTVTSEDWVLGWKRVPFDTGDEQWRLRVQAVAASDSIDISDFWFVKESDYYFDLSRTPGWITSNDHVVGLSVARPRAQGQDADTYAYGSIEYEELQEGKDFYFQRQHADANPTGVFVLRTGLMSEPLFLNVSCPWTAPYGVTRAYTAETDTTDCNRDLHLAQCKILLAERYPGKKWAQMVGAQGASEKMTLLGQIAPKPAQPRMTGWMRRPFG